MKNEPLTLPGVVFIILILISVLGLKLDALWSVIIGLIGFGITYFLIQEKK